MAPTKKPATFVCGHCPSKYVYEKGLKGHMKEKHKAATGPIEDALNVKPQQGDLQRM